MFDPPPFAGPVGATSADLEEEEDDDDDEERAGPSRSAVRRAARREARRSSPYVAASGREGSAAGPSSWNQGGSPFFGRSTGMVQPLAEGQLTPPPGWMRGLGEEQALVASRGGYPQGARQHRRPARRRFDRRAAPCCDAGQHLRATSGERTHTRPRLVAGPAMTCDTARLARRVGTGSTDYKVLIKKLRDASTRVSSATTPAHCGAGV